MKRYLPVFAALALSLTSAFVPSLRAGEWDRKTIITISQPISVEGTMLPAGKYVLTLQDSASLRDVVYIFNQDETRLITTVLTNHTYRAQPTDDSQFSFYNSSAGAPPGFARLVLSRRERGLRVSEAPALGRNRV